MQGGITPTLHELRVRQLERFLRRRDRVGYQRTVVDARRRTRLYLDHVYRGVDGVPQHEVLLLSFNSVRELDRFLVEQLHARGWSGTHLLDSPRFQHSWQY